MKDREIIAVVGMPGAGKSEAAAFFKEKGVAVLRFGDVVIDGLREQNLPITPENELRYRENIRKEHGMAAVAIKMQPKIHTALQESGSVVLDGLYSWEEYKVLKVEFPQLFLLCVYASSKIRYERLTDRPERPFTKDQARKRDYHEIEELNKGGPIALADYVIKNESTKEAFQEELETFYQNV